MIKKCLTCLKEFYTKPCLERIGKGKYCSQTCYWKSKETKVIIICETCKKSFLAWICQDRKYCSFNCRKIWNKGLTKEVDKRVDYKRPTAFNSKNTSGEKHWNWKGGITDDRRCHDYKKFIKSVYKRDGYSCQVCGERGKKLNCDHIKPWSLFPEERFKMYNVRTLCIDCHRKTDTYGKGVYNYANYKSF